MALGDACRVGSWHTRCMTVLKAILAALGETMAPDGTMVKIRLRVTLDMLVTLMVTVLAVVLAVGYQVLGRWARRSDPSD